MQAYEIRFQPNPRRENETWIRFANSLDEATESARKALADEYFGWAILNSVRETEIPNEEG